MTLYDTKLHKIWLVPLDITGVLAGGVVATSKLGGIGGDINNFSNYLISPLVYVRSMSGNLSARNRDLNPIGLKRNIRQHFGSNSNKVVLDAYISPIENTFVEFNNPLGRDIAVTGTASKFLFLKTAILNQIRFLLLYNNDFEVVTLDVLDYKEHATKPYIYDISLQATSIRSYDGYPFYLAQLGSDIFMNTLAQNFLPTMVI